MPLPPPPARALISTGKPISAALLGQRNAAPDRRHDSRARPARASASINALAASFRPMALIADGGGPMKTSPAASTASAKSAFSDKEPVARMDRLRRPTRWRPRRCARPKDSFRRRRSADAESLVGKLDMQRAGIRVGIDGDRADAHAPCGADDAAGDFTAIGNEYLRETSINFPVYCAAMTSTSRSQAPSKMPAITTVIAGARFPDIRCGFRGWPSSGAGRRDR